MIQIIRQRVVVVIALSLTIFSATTSVLNGLMDSPAAFAASEGYVITSAGAPTIFSSRVGMDMASILEDMDNITGVSPEVFAFSTWNGHSFVVRGVDFERLSSVGPEIVTSLSADIGAGPLGYGLLGHRLEERLGIPLPSTIPLTGSYSHTMEVVVVVGTFSSGSSLDDEMLVTADVARRLTGMSEDEASLIRVSSSNPAELESLLSPDHARFTIHNMTVSKNLLVPGESCNVSVWVKNWGASAGSATVSFADDGAMFFEESVSLGASESREVCALFSSELVGARELTASISGDFPVTLGSSVEVVPPYLVSSFPGRVTLDSVVRVRLTVYDGLPASGVFVTLSDSVPSTVTTDSTGTCYLVADEPGTFSIVFDTTGTEFEGMPVRGSSDEVEVIDPSSYPYEFLPMVSSLRVTPTSVKEGETATVAVTVENRGALDGVTLVEVLVDSEVYASFEVALDPAEVVVRSRAIEGLFPGQHTIQCGDFSLLFEVAPWYADNPDLVQLVLRYGGSSTLSSSGAVPIYQAAKISEGNVALALFAIGTIAAMLATLAIVSVFSKEIREARKSLGVLRALGASREKIRSLMFSQALVSSLAGSAVGASMGLLVTALLVESGTFVIFGHSLQFDVSLGLAALTVLGAVIISLASSLASAEIAVRETTMSSIRNLPEEDYYEDASGL